MAFYRVNSSGGTSDYVLALAGYEEGTYRSLWGVDSDGNGYPVNQAISISGFVSVPSGSAVTRTLTAQCDIDIIRYAQQTRTVTTTHVNSGGTYTLYLYQDIYIITKS